MKWVDVNEQLPIPQRRVLVAMHAGTEWEFKAVGVFCQDHWLVDGEARLIPLQEVQYWAPIASTPRRGK
jgi:hypothetical protein